MSDNATLLAAVLAVVYVAYLATRNASAATVYDDQPDQTTALWEDALVAIDPSTYSLGNLDAGTASTNMGAFLDTIAYAEGTAGPNGYKTMFGYRYFSSYADHPRQYFDYVDGAGRALKTSAAGRYQLIVKTWDSLKSKLGLVDFSPASQDAAAIELIRERGALNDVKSGNIASAIAKCAPVWASLPGAGYNQPERQLTALLQAFQNSGGQLA